MDLMLEWDRALAAKPKTTLSYGQYEDLVVRCGRCAAVMDRTKTPLEELMERLERLEQEGP